MIIDGISSQNPVTLFLLYTQAAGKAFEHKNGDIYAYRKYATIANKLADKILVLLGA